MRIGLSLAAVCALASLSFTASADVQHVIGKGHTIEAIAHRYHVSVQSILEANHLKDVKHLKVGDTLIVPKAEAKGEKGDKGARSDKKHDGDKDKKDATKGKAAKDGKDAKEPSYATKAKTPGVVHIKRVATTEEADIRIVDAAGKVSPATLKSFEKLMRSPSGASHPIEPRLVSLVGILSNHFGSRKVEVISGFRPYTPTQYTPHSNHNHGKAIDFRVVGVPNEVVRDFCRTLRNVGCGYYPNSTFVHMDVRDASAFWIDYSKPGEPPRYNAANVDADEGTSDVHGDGHPAANTPPPAAPASPASPASPSDVSDAPASLETPSAPAAPEEKPAG